MNRAEMTAHILRRLDESIASTWNAPGKVTRHCAIDDLLPAEVATQIHGAFPLDGNGFTCRNTFRERKHTSCELDRFLPILADITYALQDPAVVARISDLTGIAGLEPDRHLYAGGLSMMFGGDFLNPHIDNSHERTRSKYRRINLLYYVTPDWRQEWGGNLELWDNRVDIPVTIHSRFNRLVLMETNRHSWHSVSPVDPVVSAGRCCVSSYYFSEASPTGQAYYHATSFTGRPGQILRRAVGVLDNPARTVARKLGATRAANLGASNQMLKAVGGWSGDQEVSTYTAAADQARLAADTLDAVIAFDAGLANRGETK